jgi:UDP-glucose 4-epimerase
MTILVTGGAGYIGSHVAHALADAGERFAVIDDLSAGSRTALPPGAPFIEGNVGDSDLVGRALRELRVTAIMHLAASVSVEASVRDPEGYRRNNVDNMRALLESAARAGVRQVLFSSSASIYGDYGADPIPEDAPIRPISPYGETKAEGEELLRDSAERGGFGFGTLRFFNVAGADPRSRTGFSGKKATHLVTLAIETALGRRSSFDIYGTDYPTPDGTCLRDYVHVSDLADLHLLALAHLRKSGQSFTLNCGYGRGFSVREVIAAVKRVSGVDFSVNEAPRRPGDPASLVADTRRLRETMSWTPHHDNLDAIVRDALAWAKRQS